MKNRSYVKEYEEFIQDYEDSQKHIKLFVDIDSNSNFDYESKNIDIGEFKKSEKFIPKINLVKKRKTNKKDNLF